MPLIVAIGWNFNKFLVVNGVTRRRFTEDVPMKEIEVIIKRILTEEAERRKTTDIESELR